MEAKALWMNIVAIIVNFLYMYILTKFGYPITLTTNQGLHFCTDVIKYVIGHFLLKHFHFTTYYPQENG
jgi:hypothetical protein